MLQQQQRFSSLKKHSHFLSRRFRSSTSSTDQPQTEEWKEQQQHRQQPVSIIVDEENNNKRNHSTGTLGRRISRMFHNNTNRLSAPSPATTTTRLSDTVNLTAVNNYNYRHSSDETYYNKPHKNSNSNNNNNNNNNSNNNNANDTDNNAYNNNNLITALFHGGKRSRSNSANIAMTEKIEIDSEEIPEYALLPTTTVSPLHHHRPSFKEVLWNSCPGLDQFSRSRTSSVEKYTCHNNNNNNNNSPSLLPPSSQQQQQSTVMMTDERYVHSTTSSEEEDEEEAVMTPVSATACSDVMFWDINNIDQNEIIYNNNNNNNKKISLAEQVDKVLGTAFHEADEDLEYEQEEEKKILLTINDDPY